MSSRTNNNGKSSKKIQGRNKISPYLNFCFEQRPLLKEEYPELSMGKMGKLLVGIWKNLSEQEKLYYDSNTYDNNSKPKDFSDYAATVMKKDNEKNFDFKNLPKADMNVSEDETLDNNPEIVRSL